MTAGGDWSEDEVADGERDTAALLRAVVRGDSEEIRVILDNAGPRGVRYAAEELLKLAAAWIVWATGAAALVDDPDKAETLNAVLAMDWRECLAEPAMREAVEGNIEGMQDRVIRKNL